MSVRSWAHEVRYRLTAESSGNVSMGTTEELLWWLDPGERSGLAEVWYSPAVLATSGVVASLAEWRIGSIGGSSMAQVDWLVARVGYAPGAVFGCEDFILRRSESSRSLLSPVVVGRQFEYAMHERGHTVVWQMPGERSVVTPARLRAWGLWHRGMGTRDGKDALAAWQHALVWLKKFSSEIQTAVPAE